MIDRPAIIYSGYTNRLPAYSFPDMPYPVALHKCRKDNDYEIGLRSLWKAKADLVIIEHDIVATPSHVRDLLQCPHIICAYAYWIYPATTGRKEPVIAHHCGDDFITEGQQFAEMVSFGLTKLSRYARGEITDWDSKGSWRNLDERVSKAFRDEGFQFHIHWPIVEHLHR